MDEVWVWEFDDGDGSRLEEWSYYTNPEAAMRAAQAHHDEYEGSPSPLHWELKTVVSTWWEAGYDDARYFVARLVQE